MNPQQRLAEAAAAAIYVPGSLVAFFAHTLPIIQWCAGVLAGIAAVMAIWRGFRRPKSQP